MINRLISAERENCCDDLVVQTTNNPLVYARALLKLEESRHANLQLALAASTKKTYLLTRIERIMKTQQKIGNIRHLVLAILLLAGSLSSIAWLNPEIKNGKVAVNAVKPAEVINNFNSLFTDTTRKKAAKATVKSIKKNKAGSSATNRITYHDNGRTYYTEGLKDPELERLSAEVNRYAEVVGKYYDCQKFKSFSTQMDKYGKEVDAFYNSDRIKRITAEQSKLGADFGAISSNPNAEQYGKQMEVLGKKIEKYFNSADFKDLNAKLKAKYGIKSDYNDDRDDNYRKYQDELQSKLSPDIKAQTTEMRQLGEKMRSFYQSDEFVTKRDKLRAMSDSMREAYNNPAIKQQQEEMRKLGDQMRAYADNPEIKKQKELLRKASDKLRAYTNTPEFRAKVKEYKASRKGYDWDNDNDNNKDNDNNNDNNNSNQNDVKEAPTAPDSPVKP